MRGGEKVLGAGHGGGSSRAACPHPLPPLPQGHRRVPALYSRVISGNCPKIRAAGGVGTARSHLGARNQLLGADDQPAALGSGAAGGRGERGSTVRARRGARGMLNFVPLPQALGDAAAATAPAPPAGRPDRSREGRCAARGGDGGAGGRAHLVLGAARARSAAVEVPAVILAAGALNARPETIVFQGGTASGSGRQPL